MPLCNTTSAALLELSALGNPDVHSYCNPEASLWVQAFQRITNYAIAEQDVVFSNPPPSTVVWPAQKCVKAEIPRAGDMIAGAYFVCRLGALPMPTSTASTSTFTIWTPAVGYALLERSRLIVGSQVLEDFGSEYLMMYDEVHRSEGRRGGMAVGDYGRYIRAGAMEDDGAALANNPHRQDEDVIQRGIEYSSRNQQLFTYVPFHFSGHPGNALNMIGLQQHRVEVEFDIRSHDDLVLSLTIDRDTGELSTNAIPASGFMTEAKLRVQYVHLDTAERRHRAQMPATIMFIYPQSQEIITTAADSNTTRSVRNYHSHPIIDWLFCYRANDRIVTSGLKQWFFFGGLSSAKTIVQGVQGAATARYAPQEVYDAITQVQVDLNSHTRLNTRTDYLRLALPAQRAARVPSRIVYQYPLALDSTDQCGPPGTLNLSRVDNITLKFTFREAGGGEAGPHLFTLAEREQIGDLNSQSANTGANQDAEQINGGNLAGKIFWYARTLNYYKQQGGMIGLLYSS